MTKKDILELRDLLSDNNKSMGRFLLKHTAKLMSWMITIFVMFMVGIAFAAHGFWANDRFLTALAEMKWVIIVMYSTLELMLGGGMMVKKFVETKYSSDVSDTTEDV